MNKKSQSTHPNRQKKNNGELGVSGKMRFFYVLILLLMIFSLFTRVSTERRATAGQVSPGTAARVLVFHHQDESLCEDLTITSAGNAVFSNCGKGIEKQYVLNSSERSQVQSWIDTYSPVNYDPDQGGGSATQLYVNGRGRQQASDADIQQMADFAMQLAEKIGSSS
jgi:hypothetical protein